MKLFQYRDEAEVRLGAVTPDGALDVRRAVGDRDLPVTLAAVLSDPDGSERLSAWLDSLELTDAWRLDETMLPYAPCVTNPEKIICIGMNYREHVRETGGQMPDVPVIFSKFNNSLIGAGEPVTIPPNMEQADYEVELGVVIGRETRSVSIDSALDYVSGYCTVNDLSARDWQMRTSQWLLGKTPDGFMPVGPYLVTADEIQNPQNLGLRTWVNGELRQNSNTADMIFSVAEIISYISQYFTLRPGDLISTGTPFGVILGMKEKHWLRTGDEVVVEIEGLGRCITRMV